MDATDTRFRTPGSEPEHQGQAANEREVAISTARSILRDPAPYGGNIAVLARQYLRAIGLVE